MAVVILNLDDGLSTLRLLDTLKASRNRLYDLEVVVVDNGSLDDSAVAIAEALTRFDHAHLIANSANRGSAEGRNQAIRFLLERDPKQQPDYILTLDNDTLLDPGVIDGLVSHALASPPHEVAFAPLMYFADRPQRRWANWWTSGWRLPVQIESDWHLRDAYNKGRTVDGVATAAVLIKTSAFLDVGLFDDGLFFGHEDTEWFARVRARGLEIKVVPVDGKVLHVCHQSLGGNDFGNTAPQRTYYVVRNTVLLMARNRSRKRSTLSDLLRLTLCLLRFSFGALTNLDGQRVRAIRSGLRDGLNGIPGPGAGPGFRKPPADAAEHSIEPASKPRLPAVAYFSGVGAITGILTFVYAMTIDWSQSLMAVAVFQTLCIGFLLWAVADAVMQLGILVLLRLLRPGWRWAQKDLSKGLSASHRSLLAYMLRANQPENAVEAFDNMYRSYLDNLDPDGHLTAVLVSASTPLSIIRHEVDLRDVYRQRIRTVLRTEGRSLLALETARRRGHLEAHPRRDFWLGLLDRWESRGYTQERISRALDEVVDLASTNFKYLHRNGTVLKKAGQYQDLLLLASRGIEHPFTYLDSDYGTLGRPAHRSLFGFEGNIDNDLALDATELDQVLSDLTARGSSDIENLRIAGATHGQPVDLSYRYTLLLDADTRVPRGRARPLIAIAAANPDRGFLQPGLVPSNLETWHGFRELLAHRTAPKLPEALFRTLGRFGAYGKGLANNDLFLAQFVGTPSAPRETLPIDILSHDTIEALYLNPGYVPEVEFHESVAGNLLSRRTQLTRWALGDLMNAALMFPKTLGRALSLARRAFGARQNAHWDNRHTLPPAPFTARYIAHLSVRSHLQAPLFLLWLLVETFGQSYLTHTHAMLMKAHLYVVLLGLVLLPKLYGPTLHAVSMVRQWAAGRTEHALDSMHEAWRSLVAGGIEIGSAPFIYMPDIIGGPVRVARALHSLITGRIGWKVQAEAERETRQVSLAGATRAAWYIPALACLVVILLWHSGAVPSILLLAMLVTWTLFPITTWLGSKRFSTEGPVASRLLWLTSGYEPDRLTAPSKQIEAGMPTFPVPLDARLKGLVMPRHPTG